MSHDNIVVVLQSNPFVSTLVSLSDAFILVCYSFWQEVLDKREINFVNSEARNLDSWLENIDRSLKIIDKFLV